jgi:hypothetical protein
VNVTPAFFGDSAMDERKDRLTNHDTPFLYNILVGTLAGPGAEGFTLDELDANNPQEQHNSRASTTDNALQDPSNKSSDLSPDEAEELMYEGDVISTSNPALQHRQACSAQVRKFYQVGLGSFKC